MLVGPLNLNTTRASSCAVVVAAELQEYSFLLWLLLLDQFSVMPDPEKD